MKRCFVRILSTSLLCSAASLLLAQSPDPPIGHFYEFSRRAGKTHLWHGTRARRVATHPFRVKIVYEGERKWYTRQSKAHSAKRT